MAPDIDDRLVQAIQSDPAAVEKMVSIYLRVAKERITQQLAPRVRIGADPSLLAARVVYSVLSDIRSERIFVSTAEELRGAIIVKSIWRAISAARRETNDKRNVYRNECGDVSLMESSVSPPDTELAVREHIERATAIIHRELTSERREAVLLVMFEECTHKEAADIVNQASAANAAANGTARPKTLTPHIVGHAVRAIRIKIQRELRLGCYDD